MQRTRMPRWLGVRGACWKSGGMRNFKEAFQKAIRSLELGRYGLGADGKDIYTSEFISGLSKDEKENLKLKLLTKLQTPRSNNIFFIRYAMLAGASVDEIHYSTKIDKWFFYQLRDIVATELELYEYEM